MSFRRQWLQTGDICAPCLRKLLRAQRSGSARRFASIANPGTSGQLLAKGRYFWDNNVWPTVGSNGGAIKSSKGLSGLTGSSSPDDSTTAQAVQSSTQLGESDVFPHRRRKRRKQQESADAAEQEKALPLDASSQLSDLSAQAPSQTLRRRALAYLSLSKPRLSFLIVLTTTASYSLFPVAVSPMASSMSLSPVTLVALTTGTALASASANAFNMLFEPAYDAKMTRTRARPLVRGLLSSRGALIFALGTGAVGTALLHFGVNPTTAFLGLANIVLYAGVYTPMKRLSIWNTWAGAVVGGIPPLMGWAAAAGQATPYADATWQDLLFAPDGSSIGGWLLAGLLFAWQFPHFWALAYPIRSEYAAAGYKMLVSYDVRKTARIALRYSVLMFPICAGLSYTGVTSWAFVPASSIVNGWMAREAWRYLKHEGAKGSARSLFWASVWHLPVVLVLAMIMKKGLWERFIQGGLTEDELRTWQLEEENEMTEDARST